jgi:MFS family permease
MKHPFQRFPSLNIGSTDSHPRRSGVNASGTGLRTGVPRRAGASPTPTLQGRLLCEAALRDAAGMKPRSLPGGVIALGFVSLFMDISSEMIHSLLPVFLVSVIGVSALSVGIIEGVAEATASVSKVFAGAISDWIGRRKPLLLLGYGLAALTKPLFPLATGVGAVLTARFLDRIGKGIRGAPRDALVADLTPRELRGAAYGLRQALDTVGAVLGPGIALLLMPLSGNDFRLVFWVAVIPAFVAVAIIALGVREPASRPSAGARGSPIPLKTATRLPALYWAVVSFATVLTLARFSEAFLLLRATDLGLAVALVPLVMIVMNVAYALSAYPAGALSDRMNRRLLLLIGILPLIGADLFLAWASAIWFVYAGAVLWGLHMGATQGLLTAIVAEAAPADLRGTAFGVFSLTTGLALLLASLLAGWLWTAIGPAMTFFAGAGFSGIAMLGLLFAHARRTQ